jgi:hypothetical protein
MEGAGDSELPPRPSLLDVLLRRRSNGREGGEWCLNEEKKNGQGAALSPETSTHPKKILPFPQIPNP